MSRLRSLNKNKQETDEEDLGGQMSFLEHLDELRTRLIRSMIFILLAAFLCWFVSDRIYNFLARPVLRALTEAQQQRRVNIVGPNGQLSTLLLNSLKPNDRLRFVFPDLTRLGPAAIQPGASVLARVDFDSQGQVGLFTDEPMLVGNDVIPKDVKLPIDLNRGYDKLPDINSMLVVDTAGGAFALYVKVSLYAALALSVPFLLWQIWAFISPGLYPHERKYVTPFIGLSTIFFVLGAATAYYLSAGCKIPPRSGPGFSPAVEGRRVFRFHHSADAGDGPGISDARHYLCAGPHWPDNRRVDAADLADRRRRHSHRGRGALADRRRSQHVAVCGANVRLIRDFHSGRLGFRAETPRRLN